MGVEAVAALTQRLRVDVDGVLGAGGVLILVLRLIHVEHVFEEVEERDKLVLG